MTTKNLFFDKNFLHHAFLIEGDFLTSEKIAEIIEKESGISGKGNPDFYAKDFQNFGIDEGKEIVNKMSNKSMSGADKIFIISCAGITADAQNSLLKVFEEPPVGNYFFLCVGPGVKIFTTLRSRFLSVNVKDFFDKKESSIDLQKFLKSSAGNRIQMLADLIEEKDRKALAQIVFDCIKIAKEEMIKNPNEKEFVKKLDQASKIADLFSMSGISLKMVMESFSILLPTIV